MTLKLFHAYRWYAKFECFKCNGLKTQFAILYLTIELLEQLYATVRNILSFFNSLSKKIRFRCINCIALVLSSLTEHLNQQKITFSNIILCVLQELRSVARENLLQDPVHQAAYQQPWVWGDVRHRWSLSQWGDYVPQDDSFVRRHNVMPSLLPCRQWCHHPGGSPGARVHNGWSVQGIRLKDLKARYKGTYKFGLYEKLLAFLYIFTVL